MTPAARLNAAIEILDRIRTGQAVEQALTGWARANRFAGSGDRAAIRDHVFDVLRQMRSCAHLGGGQDGRALVIGLLRAQGADPSSIFTGEGHAPAPLTAAEQGFSPAPMPEPVALDCPDWLWPQMQDSLGPDCAPVLRLLQQRAPVFLRANIAKGTRAQAITALARDGIIAQAHPLADTAIEVTENPRAIRNSAAFTAGLVELQDAASQAIIAALPDLRGLSVLDYCAGGGGKALAMAAQGARVTAHDVNVARMQDVAPRAQRAGVRIATTQRPAGLFDLVLADAPCSGSGSWRRAPAGKWLLDADGLARLTGLQASILRDCANHVRPGGWLAYATCSLLQAENAQQATQFASARPDFPLQDMVSLTPLSGGDGFFLALFKRNT